MKQIINVILFLITCIALSSCTERNSETSLTGSFTVTCAVDASLKRDSATLYLIEENYHKIVNCGLRTVEPGNPFEWNGHIDGAKAAFIQFAGDSVPFYLIVEPGQCHITRNCATWSIAGGRGNAEYSRFMAHRQSIERAINQVFKNYMKQVQDSTLTQQLEQSYVTQDSVLRDSLQRYTAWRMTTGGPVSLVTREKYYKTLPKRLKDKATNL